MKYRGYKITKRNEVYTIHWSIKSISKANTLDDAKWMIDQELKEDE